MKSLYENKMGQCINRASGKLKKTFNTFEEAVDWAKLMNENPKFIHKQVAYKCEQCLKFHTGKSKHNTILIHKENIYNSLNSIHSIDLMEQNIQI